MPSPTFAPVDWLSAIRRHTVVSAAGNLLWEFAQLPLYTLWRDGTVREILFAVLHCTGGDLLIAWSSLGAALLVFGRSRWPDERFAPVAVAAVAIGVGYTIFSEWLNVEVRGAWAYTELMPVVPGLGTGLSPLLQWIVIPGLAFASLRGGFPVATQVRTGSVPVNGKPVR